MIRAQQYELRSQEAFGMAAAHHVFGAQARRLRELFEAEAHELSSEHHGLYELLRFYQKKMRHLGATLATQECIISKLSNHISTSMKGRLRERVQQKEVLNANPVLDDDELYQEQVSSDSDPLRRGLYGQTFDLYGGSFRLYELPEREAALTNVILREKQVEIRGLQEKLEAEEGMHHFLMTDWERSVHEVTDLKIALADSAKRMADQQVEHEAYVASVKKKYEKELRKMRNEMRKQEGFVKKYRAYVTRELELHNKIRAGLEEQVRAYRDNVRRMKAVLRVPRLCRQYHDRMSQ